MGADHTGDMKVIPKTIGYPTITVMACVLLLLLFPQVWTISPSADDYMPPLAKYSGRYRTARGR